MLPSVTLPMRTTLSMNGAKCKHALESIVSLVGPVDCEDNGTLIISPLAHLPAPVQKGPDAVG